MKVSNETKVGALTVVAITMMVLGYNFLKGKSLLKKSKSIYVVFNNVGTIERSNVVKINGFQIGNVSGITNLDKRISKILLTIDILEDIEIPKNSVAVVQSSLTASSYISIIPGDSPEMMQYGDTLVSRDSPDIIAKLTHEMEPALANINIALDSLKLLLGSMNSVFDQENKNNLKAVISNLNTASGNLNVLLNSKDGSLARMLGNAESISENLKNNNDVLTATLKNFKNVSEQLSKAELDSLALTIQSTTATLNQVLQKINSKEGSLGLLANDPALYRNLQQTTRSLNILLDDFKTHPKRYINVSVFGKKDKSTPLMAPLADSIQNNDPR